jgi:hypothetical protein
LYAFVHGSAVFTGEANTLRLLLGIANAEGITAGETLYTV